MSRPSPRIPFLAFAFAGVALAAAADPQTAYKGHGAESVPAEVIAKYAPKPLPAGLARRIQSMMDVRAPGMGQPSPDGTQPLLRVVRHGDAAGLAPRRTGPLPSPADRRRGPHDPRGRLPRRQDSRPAARPEGGGEPRPLPDAGSGRPSHRGPARRGCPDLLPVRQRGREVGLLRRERPEAGLVHRLPLERRHEAEGGPRHRAGSLEHRRPSPRRHAPPLEGHRLAHIGILGVGPGDEEADGGPRTGQARGVHGRLRCRPRAAPRPDAEARRVPPPLPSRGRKADADHGRSRVGRLGLQRSTRRRRASSTRSTRRATRSSSPSTRRPSARSPSRSSRRGPTTSTTALRRATAATRRSASRRRRPRARPTSTTGRPAR